jgi:hypothetical protein
MSIKFRRATVRPRLLHHFFWTGARAIRIGKIGKMNLKKKQANLDLERFVVK